jgi:anti-sigma factor RsiW
MTDHLSPVTINALADGELTGSQLAHASEHLVTCSSCTSSALHQSLLKSATARAGQRYAPPPHLQDRLTRLAEQQTSWEKQRSATESSLSSAGILRWGAIAALVLVLAATVLVQHRMYQANAAAVEHAALVTEVFDQHVATLAAGQPPQVLSSDRHTVKPWFQGKIPFSFNLPENLPKDTTLDGANLVYLRNQPVAQLLFSIGRHRVSVFVTQKPASANDSAADRAGFHVLDASAAGLEMIAVSDVDPARLADLTRALQQAQTMH